jgi:hypothetical protein
LATKYLSAICANKRTAGKPGATEMESEPMTISAKPFTACGTLLLLFAPVACRRTVPMDLVVEYRHLRAAEKVLDIRQVDQNNNVGDAIAKDVDRLRLKAAARGGGGGIYIKLGADAPKVHVLLLAQEPVLNDAELAIPRSGEVVYLLRNQQWEAYPQEVTSRAEQRIRIKSDPKKKGAFALTITNIDQQPNGFKFVPAFDEDVQQTTLEQEK